MSGSTTQPWGRTGQVTLVSDGGLPDVYIDGVPAAGDAGAWLWEPLFDEPWGARVGRGEGERCLVADDLPTRDAAVMWVLRRANPEVWRAERPVVARVRRARYLGLNEWWGEVPATNPRIRYIGARHEYQRVLRWADAEARLYASEGP